MDKEKEVCAKLPEGFAALEPSLNEYLRISKDADTQIAQLNKDIAPQPRLDPPGSNRGNDNLTKQATINRLIAEKSEFYQRFNTPLQRAIQSVDQRKAKELHSAVDYHLDNNPYAGLDAGDKQEVKKVEKDDITSFKFMEQRYFSKYEAPTAIRDRSEQISFDDMSKIYFDRLDKDHPVHFDDLDIDKD